MQQYGVQTRTMTPSFYSPARIVTQDWRGSDITSDLGSSPFRLRGHGKPKSTGLENFTPQIFLHSITRISISATTVQEVQMYH